MKYKRSKIELEQLGYATLDTLYSNVEIENIISCLKKTKNIGTSFLKTKNLFAIRQLLNVIPELKGLLFNQNIIKLLSCLFDDTYFLTKALYFDKPNESNWFVSYHQDLSITVDTKIELDEYRNWTFKHEQFGVQPPIKILEDTITLRIHLDNTKKENGALKVIPKSHLKGIYRPENINWDEAVEVICEVEKGGVMLMKPLTLHASNKTTNQRQRRVIHLEFCNHELTKPLNWLERLEIKN